MVIISTFILVCIHAVTFILYYKSVKFLIKARKDCSYSDSKQWLLSCVVLLSIVALTTILYIIHYFAYLLALIGFLAFAGIVGYLGQRRVGGGFNENAES